MATVEFRYDPKNTAWFTANAAMVLKAGEPAYHDTTGLFKLGDGVTALSALSFLPIVSSSTPTLQQVLTTGNVATTTIETTGFIKTGGLSTQFLKADGTVDSSTYLTTLGTAATSLTTTGSSGASTLIANVLNVPNYTLAGLGGTTLAAVNAQNLSVFAATTSSQLAGVISDETGSGSLVFGTSPTFTTDITTPLIKGVGGFIQTFSTDAVNIGNKATTSQRMLRVGQDTSWVDIGTLVGLTSNWAIYGNQATPAIGNSAMYGNSTSTNINATNNLSLALNTSGVLSIDSLSQTSFNQLAVASGARINYTFTTSANTNQTLSTNIPNFKVTGSTKQWATGALATQYFNYFTDNTISFVGASTATNSYNTYIESVVAGTNATLTRKYSLGTSDNVAFGIANSTATLHLGVAPSASNYMLSNTAGAGSTYLNAPTGGFVVVSIGGANRFQVNNSSITFNPITATATNATTCYAFSFSSNTNQTLSTEIPGVLYNNYSRNWATGNITTQREQYIKTATYTAIGASVITSAYGFYVEAPTASTNITITNNFALGLAGSLKINDTFNIVFDTTTGTKIATATTQKLSFWNATPIVQPTTAVAAATFVANAGTAVNDASTFDGYTLGKVVKALRNAGLLA
jgi:hypothetical protein